LDSVTLFRRFVYTAVFLAFAVVFLGAYTRLTDAGLGCPDWPGCYGHWVVEASTLAPAKAWAEMVHRYAAAILGLLILFLMLLAVFGKRHPDKSIFISIVLVLLVIFQAALGRWTVTLQLLPVVVMGHLMGGLTILTLLWILALKSGHHFQSVPSDHSKKFRGWALLGVIIVFLQISLGGWTSTNYAALVCPDFPYCHGQFFPVHEFSKAFNVFMPVGKNFEGGVLDTPARMTIHVVHRLGALLTTVYLLVLGIGVLSSVRERVLKSLILFIWLILAVQITLGILNVVWMLPLQIAVMHNLGAALLLLSIVTFTYTLYAKSPHQNL
jgi:cytochrome c oxidase assembly protein subunit 15